MATPEKSVYERTQELLRQRPRTMTLNQIARETGLTTYWLRSFVAGIPEAPRNNRVETLRLYLLARR